MKVIGLTGGIGSGKSTVSRFLGEMGAVVLDADKVGHQAYQPGTETWKELVAAFGEDIVAPDSTIDRRKLGAIVFADPEALARLNRIMHPRMFDMMKARIEEYRGQGTEVVVLEAAILLEANWTPLVDEVWVTVASESIVVQRTRERTGLPEEQIKARIRSQLSNEERSQQAKVVITNNGDLEELRVKVEELWQELQK
ncbi:MAG TPA: dephospho-CoA kinase [Dehalococcoidales bacterium]|nr:dephospho-CoA kinase [Dehalococcoidales bacterium]